MRNFAMGIPANPSVPLLACFKDRTNNICFLNDYEPPNGKLGSLLCYSHLLQEGPNFLSKKKQPLQLPQPKPRYTGEEETLA